MIIAYSIGMKHTFLAFTILSLAACQAADSTPAAKAADASGSNNILATFVDQCASCHGASMEGGQAPSLLDKEWAYGGSVEAIAASIRNGIEAVGMPGFDGALSEAEILGLASLIHSQPKFDAKPTKTPAIVDVPSVEDQVVINDYISDLDEPWGFTFLKDNQVLITEKKGNLILASPDGSKVKIKRVPAVNKNRQGGLLDVATDPNDPDKTWIYLTYSHALSGNKGPSMTRLVRGKIDEGVWKDQEVLFQAKEKDYVDTGFHYGSRITFDDAGHVYFSIGDRGKMDHAQYLTKPNGKIHRLNVDGSIPADNPFVSDPDAYPSIFAYGNRNPQGLILHPKTDVLWETEHGPKGGDELNAIKPGTNYGWPEISYGINYNGTVLTPFQTKEGMAQPASQWTPSIAVCGLDVYTGDLFPEWKGRLMAGALAYETVRLIEVDGERYIGEATLIEGKGRVRDVTTGPDGAIYVALPTKIVRLSPSP